MDLEIKPFFFNDNHEQLLSFVSEGAFYDFYKSYLEKKFFSSVSDIAGLLLVCNNQIIGSTLLIIHDEKELIIGNISCTFINKNYRGKGLSSCLINESKKYCDVLTNLTPVDSIISLIERNRIEDFKPISRYQMWINPYLIRKHNSSFVLDDLPQNDFIKENTILGINFLNFKNNQENILVGFYSFKRFGIKVTEIVFVNNSLLFAKEKDMLLKCIHKKTKCNILFVDGVFVNNIEEKKRIRENKKNKSTYIKNVLALLFNKQLFLENRKYYWIKEKKQWVINYLSSELCFYK